MATAASDRPLLLQGCLNGSRAPGDHPAVPVRPEDLAAAATEAVASGAAALHIHQRGADGAQTLAAEPCGRAISAIRSACPDVPVGLTTGAWIEADPDRRLELVAAWELLPDYASVNLSEAGSVALIELLLDRGIGVEAGLWTVADAEVLLETGLAGRCVRLLLEVMEADTEDARANVAAMERLLDEAGCATPQLQHGEGDPTWPVLVRALESGRDLRIGLEDTLELPDGRRAGGNGELVTAAVELARVAGRRLESPPSGAVRP
jgi:uncharacterized protein (DUF849 family)